MARTLHQTYELYLDDGEGPARFEPLTCPADSDVFAIVRDMLIERKLESIEVHRLGAHVFTVAAREP